MRENRFSLMGSRLGRRSRPGGKFPIHRDYAEIGAIARNITFQCVGDRAILIVSRRFLGGSAYAKHRRVSYESPISSDRDNVSGHPGSHGVRELLCWGAATRVS